MTLLDQFDFPALRELLGKLGADGWLLYDFHGINPAATRVLGIKGMGTRRFFVLLPRDGTPVAIAHRIEKREGAAEIVAVVHRRIGHRLANIGVSGEVHHRRHSMLDKRRG